MDIEEERYNEVQAKKQELYESLCKHCGACCGAMDNDPNHDPCEHLKKDGQNRFFCDIYAERFGLRKTVKGELILCVSIRNMIHKAWWGRNNCAYIKDMKRFA